MDHARQTVPGQGSRTTAVSAAMLAHALEGRGVVDLHALLDALRSPRLIGDRVRALSRVGHTTGPALANGAWIALRSALGKRATERLAS